MRTDPRAATPIWELILFGGGGHDRVTCVHARIAPTFLYVVNIHVDLHVYTCTLMNCFAHHKWSIVCNRYFI
jgi:hypothetical protein